MENLTKADPELSKRMAKGLKLQSTPNTARFLQVWLQFDLTLSRPDRSPSLNIRFHHDLMPDNINLRARVR
jgi:hypothetical protein